MGQPIGDLDQRRSAADRGEREVDAFGRSAKRHLLVRHRRGHRRRQLRRHLALAHDAHEPNALAGGGADEALLLAVIADGAPGGVDAARERRVGHDATVPHPIKSSLLTTRSRLRIRKTMRSKTCGSTGTSAPLQRSSRRLGSTTLSSKKNSKLPPRLALTVTGRTLPHFAHNQKSRRPQG